MHHHPRKRFGQHFLVDHNILNKIVTAIHPSPADTMVEIGPGLGALTMLLLPIVGQMDAIELDRDLIIPLQHNCEKLGLLKLHQADALYFNYATLTSKNHSLRIVGNLPYQISTPLLFHLIEQIHIIQDMHFMLQKEVVDRIAAKINTKDYGRLSVMIQYFCEVKHLFDVKPGSFNPPPKVNSAVVRLTPKPILIKANNFDLFSKIVKEAFNYRRKTLHNSLKPFIDNEQLVAAGINPNDRPENISVEQFVKISNLLTPSS
jgi:16S rRNA (adenine1518-N6/adenine1519-N6)-dimethyltransferase